MRQSAERGSHGPTASVRNRMRRTGGPVALLVALAGSGCGGPPTPPLDPMAPRPVAVDRRYAVLYEGAQIGTVSELRIEDPAGDVTLFRAEAEGGQWLGFIDDQGRVWQRAPFEAQDVFRGVYRMEAGLAVLYEVDSPVRLEPLESAGELPEPQR